MHIIQNLIIGIVAGTLCALGGSLKDAPYEGFSPKKFMRSPVVGLFMGLVSILFTSDPILTLCFCGYTERVIVEGYKILRAAKPGKFELKEPSMLGAKLGWSKVDAN